MNQAASVYLFDRQSPDYDHKDDSSRQLLGPGKNCKLLCRKCLNFITHTSQAMEFDGSHIHIRTNPHGYSFRFACFQSAAGAEQEGVGTAEHSWFSGCTWALLSCKQCQQHLGWAFAGRGKFFALITRQLIEEGASE